jgi:hypothetical protein
LIVPGAKTIQRPVVAPHSAIRAILAAMIGDLDDGPQKNTTSELAHGGGGGAGVKELLVFATRFQPRGAVPACFVCHGES